MINKKFSFALVCILLAFVGCSDKEDGPSSNGIDAAIGTYTGTIDIIGDLDNKFNEKITVTKVSENRIRVAVVNGSLNLPTKEFNVTNNANISIQSASTEPAGLFIYEVGNKSLSFLSKQTAEEEKMYKFEGTKD